MSPQTWQSMAVPCAFIQYWSMTVCSVYLNIYPAYTLYESHMCTSENIYDHSKYVFPSKECLIYDPIGELFEKIGWC